MVEVKRREREFYTREGSTRVGSISVRIKRVEKETKGTDE